MEVRSPSAVSAASPGRRGPVKLRLADEEGLLETRLRTARASLERDKLRRVVAFPFVGRHWRFESDTAVLHITDDGRFSYSTFPAGPTPSEVATGMRRQTPRLVVAVEGVLGSGTAARDGTAHAAALAPKLSDDPLTPRRAAAIAACPPSAGGGGAAGDGDGEGHTVDGTGSVRHECEEFQGHSKLLKVEKGEWHFAISVTPFYNPTTAVVYNLTSDERPKVLYVYSPPGPTAQCGPEWTTEPPPLVALVDPHKASLPKLQVLPPHKMAARRSRGQLMRFSHSDWRLMQEGDCDPCPSSPGSRCARSRAQTYSFDTTRGPLMHTSSSTPSLAEELKMSAGEATWTVEQWRDHFRSGAAALKARGPVGRYEVGGQPCGQCG